MTDGKVAGAVKKNLFLTGGIGCGKSTSIAGALGPSIHRAGGFLTIRQRDEEGRTAAFRLMCPDGSHGRIFLERGEGSFAMHPEVFDTFGVSLLEGAQDRGFVVLDEIGGFEVLSEPFMEALMELLQSDVPCIGVLKGEGPAGKMIQSLGLEQDYSRKAEALREWMRQDENTLVFECGQFDPEGMELARQWAAEYAEK